MTASRAMRVFVTGGSGFVGGRLIRALVARGDEVLALARSERAAAAVSEAGARPVVGDLADEGWSPDLGGVALVVHSAAMVSDWGDPAQFERVNVEATRRLLTVARAASVARFVHVSTEAVLMAGSALHDVDETTPYPARHCGLYPATKARAEQAVVAANDETMTTVVVRPRLIWGDGDTSVLPQFVDAVRAGRFKWIAGGEYPTSTCHVDNVVEGILLAADRGAGGAVYFLTDGAPVRFREFLSQLLATQGVDPGNASIPRPVARTVASIAEFVWRALRLRGAPPVTRAAVALVGQEVTVSDDKARQELGYVGHVTVTQGLARMQSPQ